jgi:hypothetical protein
MEDGTYKSIQDIVPGDRVIGAFGEVNHVLALDQVVLGHRYMYKINGEHDTADDHPHISVDRKIYSCDVDAIYREWGNYYECKVRDGVAVLYNSGLKQGRVTQLQVGQVLKTITGGKEVTSIEKYTIDPRTRLYNLVVDGSHTYFVNGYAVTGWPREDDFDYDTWTQKTFKATIDDYRIPPKS